MAIDVHKLSDPDEVLQVAKAFLVAQPVHHNVILTLLYGRRRRPEPGRYWVVFEDGAPVGVAFQSPLDFEATITPMSVPAAQALAAVMSGEDPALPGVNGEAASAASLAGQWTELTKRPALPWQGQRLYEARQVTKPAGVAGQLRPARPPDRDLLVDWLQAFHDEATPGQPGQPAAIVDARLPAGHMWIWEDDGPRSMTTLAPATAGVVRVQAVYTPPEHRSHGYAGGLVAGLSARVLEQGEVPALYADLGNSISNSVYRRIGYDCVAEILRYRFG